eukprot:TRINITY_DN25116_c1_g1_i2.p1 TRINITY_DN25116_c1_g1~~TRINITY_DN25116_c1_g1_i2.p1  ORF type:complete len:704 (+),score=176.66 TRINITY_DN25116_c1_g1_i2:185-2296(+)
MEAFQNFSFRGQQGGKEEGKKGTTMFVDAEALKDEVHKDMLGKDGEYDVVSLYKETGCAQKIARSHVFGNMTLAIIFSNSLWIGIEMDLNHADSLEDAAWYFQAGEYFFCVFFTFEWGIRFFSFRRKLQGFTDHWFCFDSALVFMMLGEFLLLPFLAAGADMSDLSMIRMIRLLRLARMVRFIRSVPEIMTLLRSMKVAFRSVMSTLTLLLIFLYVFAIIFKSQLKPDDKEGYLARRFGRIGSTMWTLLLSGSLMDQVSTCANRLLEESTPIAMMFFVFIFLSSFTVLNMLIGLLCDVVTAVAAAEKEKIMVTFVRSKLNAVLMQLDTDGNGTISKAEFNELVTIPEAVQAMNELGVDIANLVSLSDHLFSEVDGGAPKSGDSASCRTSSKTDASEPEQEHVLTTADFLEMVIRLRPDNRPSVLDIVDLRKLFTQHQKYNISRIEPLEELNVKLASDMQQIADRLDALSQRHRKLIIGAKGRQVPLSLVGKADPPPNHQVESDRPSAPSYEPPVKSAGKQGMEPLAERLSELSLTEVWDFANEHEVVPWKPGLPRRERDNPKLGLAATVPAGLCLSDCRHPQAVEPCVSPATSTTVPRGDSSSPRSRFGQRSDRTRLTPAAEGEVESAVSSNIWSTTGHSDEHLPRQPRGDETDLGPGEDYALAFAAGPSSNGAAAHQGSESEQQRLQTDAALPPAGRASKSL